MRKDKGGLSSILAEAAIKIADIVLFIFHANRSLHSVERRGLLWGVLEVDQNLLVTVDCE